MEKQNDSKKVFIPAFIKSKFGIEDVELDVDEAQKIIYGNLDEELYDCGD
jgi:hypothetical protein